MNERITYSAARQRVRRQRGPAHEYPCVDCGEEAEWWTYTGGCPQEQEAWVGDTPVVYSPDPAGYIPMCRTCREYR